jgi:hypothetical protein
VRVQVVVPVRQHDAVLPLDIQLACVHDETGA